MSAGLLYTRSGVLINFRLQINSDAAPSYVSPISGSNVGTNSETTGLVGETDSGKSRCK